jgi:hypothetical protein
MIPATTVIGPPHVARQFWSARTDLTLEADKKRKADIDETLTPAAQILMSS